MKELQKCYAKDAGTLALLNKQLIEDEKSDNAMNISELEGRMKEFLETDYSAYFFIEDNQIIGYALVRNTSRPVYLRQFLIDRKYRKHHYGTTGLSNAVKTFRSKRNRCGSITLEQKWIGLLETVWF